LLSSPHRQEALSRAYIQAVAARCGMSSSTHDFDYGLDVTLHELTQQGQRVVPSGYRLDIQAKSTVNAEMDSESVRYDLKARNYGWLREPNVPVPRILVLLVLPKSEDAWTTQDEDAFVLRRCAYWTSLRCACAKSNETKIRVPLKRSDVFSVETLPGIMQRIRKGDYL
jgi:uncharacterized protein DUF4365